MISRAVKISLSLCSLCRLTFLLARPAEAQQSKLNDKIDSNIQDWLGTHKQLHENPELPLRKRKPPRSTNGIAQAPQRNY